MKTIPITKRTTCVLAVFLSASFSLVSTEAADRQPALVAPGSETTTETGIAAGAAEDTLDACIARIPKDASIGQLMMAEKGCWRDESDRKPFQAIPGARSTALFGPTEHSSLGRINDRVSLRSSE